MGKQHHLFCLVLALGVALSSATPSLAAAASQCSGSAATLGCPDVDGSVHEDGATLEGELTLGGSPGGSGGGSGGSGGGGSGTSTLPPMPCEEVFAGLCYGEGQGKPGEESASPGIPSVTIADVATFRPQDPRQWMQPDGWMVVGLPANIVASTSRHVVAGTLLGAPAEVRFTPVAYRWRYGDGTSARLTTPGASWQALGLSEFDATPTSHVYRASGTYVIELDVEFAVEYRFAGGSWRALSGTVVRPANDLIATAGEAVTVLVDRDCATAPTGPGC